MKNMYALVGVFFLLFDQLLKYFARTYPLVNIPFGTKWFGWEYFANPGIAFGVPFPNILLVIFTPIIIILLAHFLATHKKNARISFAFFFIISGAISNLIDRILFVTTIDYLRVFTGVINIADLMIVVGILVLFFNQKKEKNCRRSS